jgi:mediator of RNA polymerase II transcription subunit 5
VEVLLQIFNKLIRSAPTSADAQAIHSTIISLVSSRLEKCFQTLKRRYPNRNNIEPLLQAIRNHPSYERSVYPSVSEVEKWTSAPPNTFHAALRQTVQQLSQWAAAGALQLNPPGYTHRLIYASLKLLGVYRTLRAILEETKAQTEAGNGGAAVDIAASIICAPTLDNTVLTNHMNPPTSVRTRMNLREMLKAEFDNAASLVATDPLLAETIVRLHRRVEAQVIAVSQAGIPPSQMDIPSVDIVGVQTQNAELDKALNDAAAASMAAAGGDLQADQQALQRSIDQHLDLTAAGGGLNLSGMGVGSAGTADMGADMGNLPDLDMGDMNMGIDLGEDEDAWGLDFSNM